MRQSGILPIAQDLYVVCPSLHGSVVQNDLQIPTLLCFVTKIWYILVLLPVDWGHLPAPSMSPLEC
eukprot:scaffold28_cov180-Chaetoceros_neogracile.AAC.6